MEFWTCKKDKNGKYIKYKIPKNNHHVPKTKRLRKKKFWLFCVGCNKWFKRYKESYGTRADGKNLCRECVLKRMSIR
ncbi:hypothetical protein BK133_00870 [Paenibacillus sp. FSL H8-0548]|nr:hypothetical protein BK133_00870 [Paenibacillus sp. FSL H8-0548]